MSMDAKLRTEKLQEIIDRGEKSGSKRITYKNDITTMDVYKIPVAYLIFNQYNSRIGTFVKTHEKQYGPIDAATEEGEKKITDFLWDSQKVRNKKTEQDIKDKGQMEPGIVTKDGVVIDGNRRCMLLKKLSSSNYFLGVILDTTLESDPKEIRKLETIYQMGVDEKVDYNPIEKYLKCRDLYEEDKFTYKEIADMMGEKASDIEKYLETLKLMDDYLETQEYDRMYTRLTKEKVEGPFVDLTNYLSKQKSGKGIQGRDWTPEKEDIDDLKNVYFDCIRAGLRTDPHRIREIGNPAKGNGFF